MAVEALKILAGIGTTMLGRLLVFDALDLSVRYLSFCGDTSIGTPPPPDADPGCCTVAELAARLSAGTAPPLVDVREPDEHAAGAIPGSVNIPLGSIAASRLADNAVLYCATGARSALAREQVSRAGSVRHLAGGYRAWLAAGHDG